MRIKFNKLDKCDLFTGAVYEGGTKGNLSDDVISKLMNTGNAGGFRIKGGTNPFDLKYVILFSTLNEERWMNSIDKENRVLTYYGDNKTPGKKIIDTRKKGNLILETSFELLKKKQRKQIPPFFIFTKEERRNVIFQGLAVPKNSETIGEETLLVVQDKVGSKSIDNYKALFDIFNINRIDRKWLKDLELGTGYESQYAPKAWIDWVDTGEILSKANKITQTDYIQKDDKYL